MDQTTLWHPTAIIHPNAKIGLGTRIGAYSVIGENVVIGENCDVQEHVVVRGITTIGNESKLFPFCVIGAEPQHLGYKGEPTTVDIGNRVTLRESVTIHRGTSFGIGKTSVGDNTLVMAYTHIAHDCTVGKNVILANAIQLAGHVEVHDNVIFGGQGAMVQFCRVGRYCYIGGGSILRKDLAPFMVGKGDGFEVQGINVVGLTRQNFSPEAIANIKNIYRIFFKQHLTIGQAIEKIEQELGRADEVKLFLDFVRASKSGLIR